MKRAVFFDRNEDALDINIRYVLEDASKFELFNISKGYTPTQGDTLYLMPGVNIPRAKLKDLALNSGIKVVRDPDNANIIITGKATPGKVLHGNWYYTVEIPVVEEYIDKLDTVDEYYKENIRTAILSSESVMAYCNYGTRRDIGIRTGDVVTTHSTHYYYIDDEWKDVIDSCQNKTVYSESELLSMINGEDAVTITNEVYGQLREMFKSSDQDNHIMAMEIMANSNYVESALYLMMLLEEYGYQISNCHTKNHVNFKSMVSYFNLRVRDVDSLDPDDVSKKLVSLGLLTTDWLNILFESRLDWFLINIARSSTFSVASVVPRPEVTAVIQSEYKAEVAFDYSNNKLPYVVSTMGLDNLSALVPEEPIQEEAETEVVVETNDNDLFGVDTAIALESIRIIDEFEEIPTQSTADEPLSNNNQIKETNESTDIDWF